MYNSIANKHTNIMTILGKWQRIYTDTFPKNRELPEKWKSKSTTTVVRTVTIKKKKAKESQHVSQHSETETGEFLSSRTVKST